MIASGIWAVVPVKSLGAAKRRLAPMLSSQQRRRLVLAMLGDVLDALADTTALQGIIVISPDPDVLAAAAWAGAIRLSQAANVGFAASANEAALLAVERYGADRLMVVPADIPQANAEDFAAVIAGQAGLGCTVVPSWDGAGSNCVLLSPPTAMRFLFGFDSFRRHVDKAASVGMVARVVQNARIAHDVDEPGDLTRLLGERCGKYTTRFLHELSMRAPPVTAHRQSGRP